MNFWDPSALVALDTGEKHGDAVRRILEEDGGVALWWGAHVEYAAAGRRARRFPDSRAVGGHYCHFESAAVHVPTGLRAGAEEGGADAHQGGAALHGGLEIGGHAHGQGVQVQAGRVEFVEESA